MPLFCACARARQASFILADTTPPQFTSLPASKSFERTSSSTDDLTAALQAWVVVAHGNAVATDVSTVLTWSWTYVCQEFARLRCIVVSGGLVAPGWLSLVDAHVGDYYGYDVMHVLMVAIGV